MELLDKDDWQQADSHFADAGMVLVTVPIAITCELIREKLTQLPADCILADLTSIKTEPVNAMLEAHSGPVVGFILCLVPMWAVWRNKSWWCATDVAGEIPMVA